MQNAVAVSPNRRGDPSPARTGAMDDDWSYCMWECGVASHPQSPETKIVVFQCGPRPPSVYSESVRVKAQDPVDIQKFTNEFLTSRDFFPKCGEAVAPCESNL